MVKVSAYSVGDPGLIPGSGRSPGEGNGTSSLQGKNPLPSAIILLGAGQERQDLKLASHAGINQVQPCLSFNIRRQKVQLGLFEYRVSLAS